MGPLLLVFFQTNPFFGYVLLPIPVAVVAVVAVVLDCCGGGGGVGIKKTFLGIKKTLIGEGRKEGRTDGRKDGRKEGRRFLIKDYTLWDIYIYYMYIYMYTYICSRYLFGFY